MSTVRNPFKRRITAGVGIAALATAALFGSMLPASAADAGNINPDAAKSLTIHKYAQPAVAGTSPDGTELPDADTNGLTALENVEFTIQEVTNIDLRSNAGWAATVGLNPATIAPENLGAAKADTTDANGVINFAGLKQAVYLVTETNPGSNNIAFAAQPFLVTLPLPKASDNTWIYDVHVYPKNSLASITKNVDDSAATGLGSNVTWNIAAKVPNSSEGNELTSFAIEDKLDSRLAFVSAAVSLESNVALDPADYTVDSTTVSGTVTVTFTDTGLAKLTPGDSVKVALVTTVVSLGDGNSGIIENDASVFINDSTTTSDKAQTNWGNVIIHKIASNDKTKSLKGAEFKVYTSEDDAKADHNPVSVTSKGVTTDVFTSGDNGIVNIDGLRATVNGTGEAITYWLVETKAPTGYTIASKVSKDEPKSFKVDSVLTTTIDITVENNQTPPFTLPLTGGSGTAMFMMVGLGILAVAGGVAVRKRSTRRTVQA